jgi:GAF domain-containing protein
VFSELDDGIEDDDNPELELIARDRVTRSVETLFALLSLILERDGLRLCLRGLHHEDDHHRGTALEYLQTVLPAELRDQLLPLLSEAGPIPAARAPAELLAELVTSPIAQAFDNARSVREQLEACCDALVKMGAAFVRVWTYNRADDVLELQASVGLYTHIDGAHARVPLGSLKIGEIAASRKPHLTNHVLGDPRVPNQEWAKREGVVSFAGYPLIAEGELLGVVAVFGKHELSDDMLTALASAAREMAFGLSRSQTEAPAP